MTTLQTAFNSIIENANTSAATATAEQLVYLAKALEAIGPQAVKGDIVQAGVDQVANINSSAASIQEAIQTALEAALNSVDQSASVKVADINAALALISSAESTLEGTLSTLADAQKDSINSLVTTKINAIQTVGETFTSTLDTALSTVTAATGSALSAIEGAKADSNLYAQTRKLRLNSLLGENVL